MFKVEWVITDFFRDVQLPNSVLGSNSNINSLSRIKLGLSKASLGEDYSASSNEEGTTR